jgi:hypothetical protein
MALFTPSTGQKNALDAARKAAETSGARTDTAFQAGMDYYKSFRSRNRDLLGLQRGIGNEVKDFMSGRDISKVFKGNKAVLDAVARQNRGIMEMTGGMGTNALAKPGPGYMAKLQSLGFQRNNKAYSDAMIQGALTQHAGNIQTLGNIQGALNQDRVSGLNAVFQGAGQAAGQAGVMGNLFNLYRGHGADQRAGIMGAIQLGIGGITGLSGFGK